MCADDGSRSTFDIPPAHPDRDPMRVLKRADSAAHDAGQLTFGDFEAVADGGQQVGPIVFSNPTARQQLVSEGRVVTFRPSDRTTGDTWWRVSRTAPKEGDVTVSHLGPCHPHADELLQQHVDASGFESVDAWRTAIADLHGGLPGRGHLYEVTVR